MLTSVRWHLIVVSICTSLTSDVEHLLTRLLAVWMSLEITLTGSVYSGAAGWTGNNHGFLVSEENQSHGLPKQTENIYYI